MLLTISKVFGILLVLAYAFNSNAYGAFDANRNYYCNPDNIDLEKTIYKAAVTNLNFAIESYLSEEPDSTPQELRNFMIHSTSGTVQPTFEIMNKAQSCLSSNGVNPSSVAPPFNLIKIAYAPEFGPLVGIVVVASLVATIMIHRIVLTPKI